LTQTLFALNESYWMNEKGAVAIASAFPHTPRHWSARIDAAFGRMVPQEEALLVAVTELEQLVTEVSDLLGAAGITA
jgi:hypothetical protein